MTLGTHFACKPPSLRLGCGCFVSAGLKSSRSRVPHTLCRWQPTQCCAGTNTGKQPLHTQRPGKEKGQFCSLERGSCPREQCCTWHVLLLAGTALYLTALFWACPCLQLMGCYLTSCLSVAGSAKSAWHVWLSWWKQRSKPSLLWAPLNCYPVCLTAKQ